MEVAKFSSSGEFLGVSGTDGRLKIWDTSTSILKHEYVPSSHLTATCTCIEWSPRGNQTAGRKKKRKQTLEGDIMAIGTATGALVLYSVTKGQVLAQHKDAHSGSVTGISWSVASLLLYSCGEDGYIIEWDPETAKQTRRWRGNKSGLNAIRVFGDGILSAGHGITFWDLDTKAPSMTFTGHPSLISQLEVVPGTDYFVTMCHTERHLRIWSVKEKNSVLTLTVTEAPQCFSVLNTSNGNVAVAVATKKGPLHIFKHKLNGPVKKPLLPTTTLKVLDSLDDSKLLPVLVSYLSDDGGDDNVSLLTGYGNWLRIRFEKFAIKTLDSQTVIKREYSLQKKGKSKQRLTTTPVDNEVVEVPNNVKHLHPGLEGIAGTAVESKAKKRKKSEENGETEVGVDDGELPMEERLTNLTIETPGGAATPSSNNLAHLLSQGLHSKDTRILQSVLCRWDQDVICTTVRSLPVQLIIPLLNEIRGMLGGKSQQNNSLLKWLKNIFQIHSAYLMACPTSDELLSPFMSLLRSRETLYPQMCQLKGKLELIKGNIQAKEYKAEQPNEALLVYQDESSDEDKEDDTFLPSESEGFLESEDELGVDNDEGESSADEETNSDNDDDDGSSDSESSEENDQPNASKKSRKSNQRGNQSNHVNEESDDDNFMEADD